MFMFGGGINELLFCLVRLSSEISVVEVGIGDGLSFILLPTIDCVGVVDSDDEDDDDACCIASNLSKFDELLDEEDAIDELDVSTDSFKFACFVFLLSSFFK